MNLKTKQAIIFFTPFLILLSYFLYNQIWIPAYVFGFVVFMGVMVLLFPNAKGDSLTSDEEPSIAITGKKDYLTYYGDQLNFSSEEIVSILNKHSTYYTTLTDKDKQKFINRLNTFIEEKIFNIYDESGFKEMPVLISASAIQLSFGLEKYLLPHFVFINIHPKEFIKSYPTIRFLEGNVSGNCINISWKYFLEGFEFPQDGKNVGLHEMAHAYYYQSFGDCDDKDENFIVGFNNVNECGNKVFNESACSLYSDYSKRNFQEFWAESIEIFFEKSMEMKNIYPDLYQAISELLNQDPLKVNYSVSEI